MSRHNRRRSPTRRRSPMAVKDFWVGLSEGKYFVVIRGDGSYDNVSTPGMHTRAKQKIVQGKIKAFEADDAVTAVLLAGGRAHEFFEIFRQGGTTVPEILRNWKNVFRHHVDGKKYTL